MSADSSPAPSSPRHWDAGQWLSLVLVVATVAAFWPVTQWMFKEVAASQQIRQAFILLGAATGLVAWQHAHEWRLELEMGNRAVIFLALAYACVVLALLLHVSILVLPAFAFGLAGCLHVLVGGKAWRFIKPLVIGFVACLAIILLFPVLDWPLRQMAGVNAARMLKELGFAPQLGVITDPEPKLILATGKNFFEVATECNGFGLITSGAVLALLAGGIADRAARAFLWLVPLAIVIGFTFNLLRILAICLLAPSFPNHYHALHETAGVAMLWSGLGLIGWIAWRPPVSGDAPPTR